MLTAGQMPRICFFLASNSSGVMIPWSRSEASWVSWVVTSGAAGAARRGLGGLHRGHLGLHLGHLLLLRRGRLCRSVRLLLGRGVRRCLLLGGRSTLVVGALLRSLLLRGLLLLVSADDCRGGGADGHHSEQAGSAASDSSSHHGMVLLRCLLVAWLFGFGCEQVGAHGDGVVVSGLGDLMGDGASLDEHALRVAHGLGEVAGPEVLPDEQGC